jgi:hypothetical protein
VQLLNEKLADESTVEFLQSKCNWAKDGTPCKLGAVTLSYINSNAPGDYSSTVQVLAATHGVSIDEDLQEFIDGKVDFTISTNVVGRGVSASRLSNVVIFDFPQSLVELQQTSMRAGFCFLRFNRLVWHILLHTI